ncbi:hypothetical protein CQA53_04665 [Helicobacter didelphidarum]|uniref:Uncharacterized protein n=1 Tax=Helicobacter didelphidarum TaxID=2040648 RepID=A0A3D8IL77_9HELI|nr:hypothetical protein [Helicobacter didelphidarum]RDU66097.1 hypothetical protein CQA53_04665 [Helicobacter didelphidarum]
MKEAIERLESILNQGLYGREEEVRLALLCTLSNKTLLLYGHDDALDIQMRFAALFGEVPIKAKANSLIKNKNKLDKYTAYCEMGSHTNTDHLYQYLFTQRNTAIFEKLKQFAPEAHKLKKFFDTYNFKQFWNDENKTQAINFIESLVAHANPTGTLITDNDENNVVKQLSNISDKRFRDFLHILAVNLIINDRNNITAMDFGMFYYCLRDWSDGVKYLETTICTSLSDENLPTFIFHDEEYERTCKEEFSKRYETESTLIPNVEFLFYVPYSSSPNTQHHEIFQKIEKFYTHYQNLIVQNHYAEMDADLQELRKCEQRLKETQLQEMDLKESQLAQVQLKRSAFKSVKDGLDERLKIANAKESEYREQREVLENKYKDSKIKEQREGLESQIAEIKAKEDQYKEVRLNLEGQLQDAKNVLEDKLKQTKEILEAKMREVQTRELELQTIKKKVDYSLNNFKTNVAIKIKDARDYLAQLRSLSVGLNKAIEACKMQIDSVSRPNPIWGNPLKAHLSALYRIQKNLPNLIRVFDTQIKKYEESTKRIPH